MDNDPHRRPFAIDQGVDLATLHLLAGVITHLVVFTAPFSADLTDWLSRTAADGLASRPIRSRKAMCNSAQIGRCRRTPEPGGSTVGFTGARATGIRAICGTRSGRGWEPLIPPARPGGRPRETNMRAAMNAILYLLRTGCPWRYLPRDSFPPRSTVYNSLTQKFE